MDLYFSSYIKRSITYLQPFHLREYALLLRILGELGNVRLRVEILAYFSLRPQQRIQVLV